MISLASGQATHRYRREIARGLIAYDAADAVRIAGKKSTEIATILGYQPRAAMVHKDDLVVGRSD